MRRANGFAPDFICYDPLTATLMVAGVAMQGYGMYNSYENSRNQAKAAVQEGTNLAQQKARQTNRLAASQKASFLSSGISLTGDGTTQAIMDETFKFGLEDIGQIKSNYNSKASSIMSSARSKLFSDLGGMALSLGSLMAMPTGGTTTPLSGAGNVSSSGSSFQSMTGGGMNFPTKIN